jgi:uncharacterized phage protein gp47/JayE
MNTSFRVKTQPEILANMLARAQGLAASLGITLDINVGSVNRTTLETAALSDADQYIQIAKLLDLRSLDDAKGIDLDALAKAYGSDVFTPLRRMPARGSVTSVVASSGSVQQPAVFAGNVIAGATTFSLIDASALPSSGTAVLDRGTQQAETILWSRVGNVVTVLSGAPGLTNAHQVGSTFLLTSVASTITAATSVGATTFTLAAGTGAAWAPSGSVILDRGLLTREKLTFTRSGDVLTTTTALFVHAVGASAIQSTTSAGDQVIPSGSTCFAPATLATQQVNFQTTASGTLYDGDFSSGLIPAGSVAVGVQTNVGSGAISQWQTAPFSGAMVTNPIAATSGLDREQDDPYRQRIKNFIQSLSSGTPLSIVTKVTGLTDPTSGSTAAYAAILEPVAPGASTLYITDGTQSFAISTVVFNGRDVIIGAAASGDARGRLHNYGPFSVSSSSPTTPRLFVSSYQGVSTGVAVDTLADSSQSFTSGALVGFYLKDAGGNFYEVTSNTTNSIGVASGGFAPVPGNYAVFNFTVAPLVPGTGFTFNESNGDIELTTPLTVNQSLVAASDGAASTVGAYTYSTGLAAFIQRVVNGDPTDFADFPGIRASGTKVVVAGPTIVSPAIVIKAISATGYSDAQVQAAVVTAIQAYVNSLGIGQSVLVSEIVAATMAVAGVADCAVLSPSSNFTVSSNQLARISAANVETV